MSSARSHLGTAQSTHLPVLLHTLQRRPFLHIHCKGIESMKGPFPGLRSQTFGGVDHLLLLEDARDDSRTSCLAFPGTCRKQARIVCLRTRVPHIPELFHHVLGLLLVLVPFVRGWRVGVRASRSA